MRKEEIKKSLLELEERVRNRLVLPKTVLFEMKKLAERVESSADAIEGVVVDFTETKKKLDELL